MTCSLLLLLHNFGVPCLIMRIVVSAISMPRHTPRTLTHRVVLLVEVTSRLPYHSMRKKHDRPWVTFRMSDSGSKYLTELLAVSSAMTCIRPSNSSTWPLV